MSTQTTASLIRLREMILNRQLGVGERLREAHLAKMLGTSRTPIRAALVRLSEEGLVEELEPVGYAVRDFSERDIQEAIEMRGMIEGMAVRLAAERGVDEATILNLMQIVDNFEDALNDKKMPSDEIIDRYFELNNQFHKQLRQLANSFVVDHMFDRIVSLPFASPDAFVMKQIEFGNWRTILEIGHAQHRALVSAIKKRQGTRAESIAREHAQLSLNTIEQASEKEGGFERIQSAKLIDFAK